MVAFYEEQERLNDPKSVALKVSQLEMFKLDNRLVLPSAMNIGST